MRALIAGWCARRTLWLAIGAVVVGGASFVAAGSWLQSRARATEQRLQAGLALRRVVVAHDELANGTRLTAAQLAARDVPERYLPGDAIEVREAGALPGARLARALRAGEPLTRSALQGAEQATLSSLVEPGQRAITIAVDELSSSAGMLMPGDRIDLLYITASGPEARVEPLLQSVPVVATGRQVQHRQVRAADGATREVEFEYGTVTLHVAASDAERIVLAQRAGELTALLRHPDDSTPVALGPLQASALLTAAGGTPPVSRSGAFGAVVQFIIGGRGDQPQQRNDHLAVVDSGDKP